jgi:hypothetical protein
MFDQFLYNIVYSFSLVFIFSYFIELWRLELSSRKAWLKFTIFSIPQLFFSPLKSTSSIFIITYTKVFLKECQTIYLYNLVNSLSHYFGNSVIFNFGFWITIMLIRMKKVFFTYVPAIGILMWFILLFFCPLFVGGKRKGEKNNLSRDFKSCLSARSF